MISRRTPSHRLSLTCSFQKVGTVELFFASIPTTRRHWRWNAVTRCTELIADETYLHFVNIGPLRTVAAPRKINRPKRRRDRKLDSVKWDGKERPREFAPGPTFYGIHMHQNV
jgi:hypothetical protein